MVANEPQGNIPEEELQLGDAPAESSEETSEDSVPMPSTEPESEPGELPDEVSERTREQFEKLKQQLEEERAKNRAPEPIPSVFDPFPTAREAQVTDANNYQNLNQAQVDDIASTYIDADGNVDVDGLTRALRQANDTAVKNEKRLQYLEDALAAQDQERQERETYKEFPQLDPKKDSFDKTFFRVVRDRMVAQYAEKGRANFVEAAKEVSEYYQPKKSADKIKEEAVREYKETQQKRAQGPIESGKGPSRQPTDLEKLREKSREGDDKAIAARIQSIARGQE